MSHVKFTKIGTDVLLQKISKANLNLQQHPQLYLV